jgi:hypothetical protein
MSSFAGDQILTDSRRLEHEELVAQYAHHVSEIKLPDEWAKRFFHPEATFTIGNAPTCRGHDEMADGARKIYAVASSVKHVIDEVHSVSPDVCIAEGTVTYTIDKKVLAPLPICSIFRLVPGEKLLQSYRAYINNTPIFIAAGFDVTADASGDPLMKRRDAV